MTNNLHNLHNPSYEDRYSHLVSIMLFLSLVRTQNVNFDCIFIMLIGHFLHNLPGSSNCSHQNKKVNSIKEPF